MRLEAFGLAFTLSWSMNVVASDVDDRLGEGIVGEALLGGGAEG